MRTLAWLTCSLALVSCEPRSARLEARYEAILYDQDDRLEPYQVNDAEVRALVERASVALIPKRLLVRDGGTIRIDAPLHRELDPVCPDEPFLDQPGAAFCSGVLVDWDLILTAAHCTYAFPLDEVVAVFGYAYAAPAQLGIVPDGVFELSEIVERKLQRGSDGLSTRDFAWIRLKHAVAEPYQPVALRLAPDSLSDDAPLTYIGSAEGTPLKVDRGGRARFSRAAGDYFVADTDSTRGGSGGGAFDTEHVLTGVLFRGGEDRVAGQTCQRQNRRDGYAAEERFNHAGSALAALCQHDPTRSSLCRPNCGDPCRALAPSGGGCALSRGEPRQTALALATALLALLRRRRRLVWARAGHRLDTEVLPVAA